MLRFRIACLLLITLASAAGIVACQRQPDAPMPAQAAPAAVAPASPADTAPPPAATIRTDTTTEADHGGAGDGIDARALTGIFVGTLPCADCPGIKTTLGLKADGSYTLHELYVDRDDQDLSSNGRWSAEQDGKRIRLNPDGKNSDARLFRIVSNDELEMLDSDGNPPDSDLDYSLKRSGVVAP